MYVVLVCYVSMWFVLVPKVRDDPKLLGDNGEIPFFEWSGWRFDSRCEIFSLLDGKKTS